MRKILASLLLAACALSPWAANALGALGGSAFPLTFITSNPVNGTDEFNELLYIMNQQCAAATNTPTLTVQDSVFTIQNSSDATKQLVTSLGASTTGTKLTLSDAITSNRTVTFGDPGGNDSLAYLAATQALTNKTYNGNTFTAGTGTLTLASGKTLTVNNTQTFAGTDGQTMTFPAVSDTVAGLGTVQTFTVTQTFASLGNVSENNQLGFGGGGSVDSHNIVFANALTLNPIMLNHFQSATVASANAGITLLTASTGRTIFPGSPIIMVSGSASGGTSIQLVCQPSDVAIITWPIADLIDAKPIGTGLYLSTLSTITTAKPLVAGCSASDSIQLSTTGTIATTTQVFVNLPYTVQ